MNEKQLINEYERWCKFANKDDDVVKELVAMKDNLSLIEDAFYSNLAFGTGGLRGIIGAGTNRVNIYTIAKATQGLANYIKNNYSVNDRIVAVSYDSRIKSEVFAKVSCEVLAANDIQVYLYNRLMPTPCLSFAVRALKCSSGIMITASHNSAKYNGYKVYGDDGCQITTKAANNILSEIEKVSIFSDVKQCNFKEALTSEKIKYINESIFDDFIERVKEQTLLNDDTCVNKDVNIVYTPLNGAGLEPVCRTLRESGYKNISIVKEQELPDGNFTTCPSPNPEIKEALSLGIEYAKKEKADLVLATDPDCDRVGIAIRKNEEEYVLLNANETGILLLDYICARRIQMHRMPKEPVFIKTIVTSDMAEKIASHYGVKTKNVLTGFKFIGEQIGLLKKEEKQDSYIFGFEESYGFLSGSYVLDKDGVGASLLVCEMFAYYKTKGIGLLDKLEELYKQYGYYLTTQHSFKFEGSRGIERMNDIMKQYRGDITSLGNKQVLDKLDYDLGIDNLPKSNVIKLLLEDNCSVVIRPSGTEPKLKVYVSVCSKNKEEAKIMEKRITKELKTIHYEYFYEN